MAFDLKTFHLGDPTLAFFFLYFVYDFNFSLSLCE